MVEQTSWKQLVNPGYPIPVEATARHGITTADVKDAEPFNRMATRLRDLVVNRVVYNVAYDLRVLHREFRLSGLSGLPPQVPILDAYRIFCAQHPRTLEAALQKYCGENHPRPHDALADVQATLKVLRKQLSVDGREPTTNQFIDAQLKWSVPAPQQNQPEAAA
jgi:DNA polymerase III subunit epsilon